LVLLGSLVYYLLLALVFCWTLDKTDTDYFLYICIYGYKWIGLVIECLEFKSIPTNIYGIYFNN
jgi:hypothetical protein